MLMDEPTNHMDMETIESLQIGLEKYPGHADVRLARPRVRRARSPRASSSCKPGGNIADFSGTYDEYLQCPGHRGLSGARGPERELTPSRREHAIAVQLRS